MDETNMKQLVCEYAILARRVNAGREELKEGNATLKLIKESIEIFMKKHGLQVLKCDESGVRFEWKTRNISRKPSKDDKYKRMGEFLVPEHHEQRSNPEYLLGVGKEFFTKRIEQTIGKGPSTTLSISLTNDPSDPNALLNL
jgi:hypothetical protein